MQEKKERKKERKKEQISAGLETPLDQVVTSEMTY